VGKAGLPPLFRQGNLDKMNNNDYDSRSINPTRR